MKTLRSLLLCLGLIITTSSIHAAPIQDPGSRGVDWDKVKQKVASHKWASDIVDNLKDSVHHTQSLYEHPPLGTTGWLHEYYCDDDARRLTFDPKQPTRHVCSKCKRVYSGPPYDDCWRSMVHSNISSAAASAGILYRITGEQEWLDYAKQVLLWYADNFKNFKPHGEHAGIGIIREQSLDEAAQMVRLAQAYWDICPYLTAEERENIANNFLLPDARFIHKQTNKIHNIHSWHNAAVGLVGYAVGDKELVSAAIDGPFGLVNQIQKGVKQDGFWFEGSIGYHFYTISSLEPLYIAARAQGHPLAGADKFKLMFTALIEFAFDNAEFPAANDGWVGQSLLANTSQFETAAGLWDDPLIHSTLAYIAQGKKRSSLPALLYGVDEIDSAQTKTSKSVLFKDSGIAILRKNKVNAYLKFSPYGGGHDHLDRLNLILFGQDNVIVPDLGTSGYGIDLNKWFRSSAAHNMLTVDGQRQQKCGGYLISYEEDCVKAGVKDAYAGVDIQREISMLDNGITDIIQASSNDKHQYDLFYHIRGDLKECNLKLEKTGSFKQSNGYDYLRNIRKADCPGELRLTWALRDAPGFISFHCKSDQPFEVMVGDCPDNPADNKLGFIMLHTNDANAKWTTEIHIQPQK